MNSHEYERRAMIDQKEAVSGDSKTNSIGRWGKILGAGLLAGLVAALLMSAVIALLRLVLGIPLPSEMGGDRFLAYIGVDDFLSLIGQFGGPGGSKELALLATFQGQVAVGAPLGVLYAIIVERGRGSEEIRRFDVSRRGGLFVVVTVAAIWLITLGLFSGLVWPWSVISTNNLGIPPWWASVLTALGLLLSYALFGLVLVLAYRFMAGGARHEEQEEPTESEGRPIGRRAFMVGAAGMVLALSTDLLTRRLFENSTLPYDGTQNLGTDLEFITPNDRFYIVTKNIIDPTPAKAPWRLRVTGEVDNPITYNFDDLEAMEPVDQEQTLKCISTGVAGGLMSNAMWRGVPLPRLLEDAIPGPDVKMVRLIAVDGYTHLISFEKAMEETTLVAYEMNGEPLPELHGYPARILVPGSYGEASAKWVTRIELMNYESQDGYYEKQGWRSEYVTTSARIDSPEDGQSLSLSQSSSAPIRGVAFAGNRGISNVEVSADGGNSWQEANIDQESTPLTWVFWSYEWEPEEPGEYQLVARATDGNGDTQQAEDPNGIFDGRSGYHMIPVSVEA